MIVKNSDLYGQSSPPFLQAKMPFVCASTGMLTNQASIFGKKLSFPPSVVNAL